METIKHAVMDTRTFVLFIVAMLSQKIQIRLVLFSLCTLSLSECRERYEEHRVPNVAVNVDIDLNLAPYNDLNFIGGWVYLNGGYNGLIVHRSTQEVLAAYDRQAPYQIEDRCQIFVDTGGVTCTDECSDSQWLLFDGQLVKGPSALPLNQYITTFDGNRLSIRN
ncbi:MAG: hypothetical protein Salg2KO_16840 [Salibacteraceae bacterium]